ncbi:uracil-DNA glycosylase family protein [Brytella acorum]|uniref:hypothetical protein n=1 Tax=Brytella acorum TaxID=2959299 RepID=UPI0025AE7B69|nr:hypothetical protein [Brytella acorum]MDF3625567.1 hypothetical protein [Brytella acorum]
MTFPYSDGAPAHRKRATPAIPLDLAHVRTPYSGVEALFVIGGSLPSSRRKALEDLLDINDFPRTAEAPGTPSEIFTLTSATDDSAILPSVGPTRLGHEKLKARLRTLPRLRVAIAMGITAHVALLEACGMPRHRIPFRRDTLSILPDGLLLADIWHPLRRETLPALRTLLHDIRRHLDTGNLERPESGTEPHADEYV